MSRLRFGAALVGLWLGYAPLAAQSDVAGLAPAVRAQLDAALESADAAERAGGRSVGEMRELIDADHDGESLMRAAREGIGELITRFDATDQPYLSQPRAQYVNEYGDYDDLARRSEWASQAEGSGE